MLLADAPGAAIADEVALLDEVLASCSNDTLRDDPAADGLSRASDAAEDSGCCVPNMAPPGQRMCARVCVCVWM